MFDIARIISLLSFWRRKKPKSPKHDTNIKCVIIGPVGSGKTALLVSLRQCLNTNSHSYINRFKINLNTQMESRTDQNILENTSIEKQNNAFSIYESQLDHYFNRGLDFDATRDEFFRLDFRLTVSALVDQGKMKKNKTFEVEFNSFDGGGGLLLDSIRDIPKERVSKFIESRKELEAELKKCETFVLCLPIEGTKLSRQARRTLSDYLSRFKNTDEYHVQQVVICFTKYETLGLRYGRNAYRMLANASRAKLEIKRALEGSLRDIQQALWALNHTKGKKVWCVPVSTYGFIPHNGGANLDPHHGLLRTRESVSPLTTTIDEPYRNDEAYRHFWRPFLTADPFIFIATNIHENTLIFPLDEVLI